MLIGENGKGNRFLRNFDFNSLDRELWTQFTVFQQHEKSERIQK